MTIFLPLIRRSGSQKVTIGDIKYHMTLNIIYSCEPKTVATCILKPLKTLRGCALLFHDIPQKDKKSETLVLEVQCCKRLGGVLL
jgi:hypothetical protein